MNQRSLLYISNQRMPSEKAYGLQIAKMCEAFADAGWDVRLVIPTRRGTSAEGIFTRYAVKKNFAVSVVSSPDFYWPGRLDQVAVVIKSFFSAVRLAAFSWKHPAEILYSRDELPLYLLSFLRKNLVFEAHRYSARRVWIYRRFQAVGIHIVAISQGLKDQFIQHGFSSDRILVAHDGVALDQFAIEKTKEECRADLKLPLDVVIIGYIGQLSTLGMAKGIDVLIDAIARIHGIVADTALLVVGGSDHDIQRYRHLASLRGIPADALFFVGRKPYAVIPTYARACDVLVAPYPDIEHYRRIMSPLKIFEYMASGVPMVVSDLPVIREVLSETEAIFFDPNANNALAKAIEKVLNNKEESQKRAQRALEVVQQYSWQARAKAITNFINAH